MDRARSALGDTAGEASVRGGSAHYTGQEEIQADVANSRRRWRRTGSRMVHDGGLAGSAPARQGTTRRREFIYACATRCARSTRRSSTAADPADDTLDRRELDRSCGAVVEDYRNSPRSGLSANRACATCRPTAPFHLCWGAGTARHHRHRVPAHRRLMLSSNAGATLRARTRVTSTSEDLGGRELRRQGDPAVSSATHQRRRAPELWRSGASGSRSWSGARSEAPRPTAVSAGGFTRTSRGRSSSAGAGRRDRTKRSGVGGMWCPRQRPVTTPNDRCHP